jgi:mannose-6-phosphate isomerase-like protein (cupin superfamily)
METFDLESTYLHLGTSPGVARLPVTPDFWDRMDERADLHTGRLVTAFAMQSDWDVWEMHPAGDEVIVVTDGTVHFHLERDDEDDDGADEITVTAPEFIVVPAGTWHTADARGGARLLIITWGAGTQHRAR